MQDKETSSFIEEFLCRQNPAVLQLQSEMHIHRERSLPTIATCSSQLETPGCNTGNRSGETETTLPPAVHIDRSDENVNSGCVGGAHECVEDAEARPAPATSAEATPACRTDAVNLMPVRHIGRSHRSKLCVEDMVTEGFVVEPYILMKLQRRISSKHKLEQKKVCGQFIRFAAT